MKERILETFAELGFILEQLEDSCYDFDYEDKHMMLLTGKEDDGYLSISIPRIYGLEDGNPLVFSQLIDRINSDLKYIKAYEIGNYIWIFYQRDIEGDSDLKLSISRMIMHLDAASTYIQHEVEVIAEEVGSLEDVQDEDIEDVEFEDGIYNENEE